MDFELSEEQRLLKDSVDGITTDKPAWLREALPLEVMRRIKRVPEKVVSLDQRALLAVEGWEKVKAQKRDIEKLADRVQAEMLALLGDAEAGVLPDGRLLTYQEQTRKGYTVEPCTYRVARIRKAV